MQPGKGLGSTRESISKCGDGDIFSHIQNPQRKTVLVAQMGELDTLESEEARLLNQMLGSSVNKSLSFFLKGTKLFVKGLFLPAHFFLFRMPKWVIIKLSPKMLILSNKLNETKENISKFIQNIASKMNVIKHLSLMLKPFSALLNTAFQRLTENFLIPFKKIGSFVKEKIDQTQHFFNKIEAGFKKLQNLLKNSLTMAKRERKVKVKSFDLKKVLSQVSLYLKTHFKTPVAKRLATLQTKISQQLSKTAHLLKHAKTALLKRTKPLVDAAKNQRNKALNTCNRMKNKVTDFVTPKIEAVQQQVQKALDIVKPPLQAVVVWVQGVNERAVQLFLQNPLLQKFKSQVATLKRITVKLQKAHTAILKSFQRIGQDAKNWAKKKMATAKKYAQQQKKRVFQVVKKMGATLKAAKAYLVHFFKKFTRFFVLLFRWCRIMIKFTAYLLQEIIREARNA